MAGFPEFMPQQINAMNDYTMQFNSQFTETYNPGWRNHPNFSWTSQSQPMSNIGSYSPYQSALPTQSPLVTPQQFSSLEDTLNKFIQATNQNTQTTNQILQEVRNTGLMHTQAIIKLESQMDQIASQLGEREMDKFSSQPIPNPKGVSSDETTSNPLNVPTHGQVHFDSLKEDPLEACLSHFGYDFDIDESIEEVNALLDSVPVMGTNFFQPKPMPLKLSSTPRPPSIEKDANKDEDDQALDSNEVKQISPVLISQKDNLEEYIRVDLGEDKINILDEFKFGGELQSSKHAYQIKEKTKRRHEKTIFAIEPD